MFLSLSRVQQIEKNGRKYLTRKCPFCLRSSDPDKRARALQYRNNFHRHMIRNHLQWMYNLYEQQQWMRLYFLGNDLSGTLGDYLKYHSIVAACGQLPRGPFDPKKDWLMGSALLASFPHLGYPELPSTVVPSEEAHRTEDANCMVCFETAGTKVVDEATGKETVLKLLPVHDEHLMCRDCMETFYLNLVQKESSKFDCPMCRKELAVADLDTALYSGQTGTDALEKAPSALPLEQHMETILPYSPPRTTTTNTVQLDGTRVTVSTTPGPSGWVRRVDRHRVSAERPMPRVQILLDNLDSHDLSPEEQ